MQQDLFTEFVVLSPEKTATVMPVTPSLYQELDTRFNQFIGHELISAYEFTSDWNSWEMHPKGDEIVLLIQGNITFILDIAGKHQTVQLNKPGSYVVVPRGTWHTAHTTTPSKVLFITPGEGTEHKEDT